MNKIRLYTDISENIICNEIQMVTYDHCLPEYITFGECVYIHMGLMYDADDETFIQAYEYTQK